MPVLISDAELDALEGLPHLHRCLYIFGIRRHMDYKTGISGIKRKISYKSLSEEVYVTPRSGVSELCIPSVAQLKRAVKFLEKNGLLSIHSIATKDEKQLILKCVLAPTDDSVQKQAVPRPYQSPIREAVPAKNQENTVKTGKKYKDENSGRTAGRTSENLQAVPHPISDRLDKIRSDGAEKTLTQVFMDLLAKRGFYLNHVTHSKTVAMLHAWIKGGITPEEADIAMTHCDNQLGHRPEHPTYYAKVPFQYRNDLNNASQHAKEVTHVKRQKNYAANTHARVRAELDAIPDEWGD